MLEKSVWLAALASLGLAGVASAALVPLDPFLTAQSATTTPSNSSVMTTQTPGDLFGAFGDRELTATRVLGVGQVGASIGGGNFGCQRPQFAVSSFCVASYEVKYAFTLSGLMFNGWSNGDPLNLGLGLVEFYQNSDLIGSQVLGIGTASYSISTVVDWVSGDAFRIALRGTPGDDLRMSDLRGNVVNQGQVVSEPGSIALAGFGLLSLSLLRRRSVA